MAYSKEFILHEYPSEVTDILKATKEDPEDENARNKVAVSLARSLAVAKRITGRDRKPQDTELYHLASTIQQNQDREEFIQTLREEFPKQKENILTKYGLDWKLPGETETKKRRGRLPRGSRIQDVSTRIEKLEKAVIQIKAQLSQLETKREPAGLKRISSALEEVLQKLRNHQHDSESGKAYIMEKKEL